MVEIEVGYIIASHDVMILGKPVRYFYREEPDSNDDSGWRFFSGEETQEYADEAGNFSMYNAKDIVHFQPNISRFLSYDYPVEFIWDEILETFVLG